MALATTRTDLTMDIVSGKCHVLKQGKESIYSSDNAFEALNYIAKENSSFAISDVASLWIDIECYEAMINGMKQNPELFQACA